MNLRIQDLNMNALWHFHIVAKHQSLSLAAKELSLSAPAVTHSLNNLEASIGDSLCIRNRSEFFLTPIGQHLFKVTEKIFDELESFTKDPNGATDFNGILSIGILDHFEDPKFETILKKLIKKYPNVKLNIQSYDSDLINKKLIEKEIDIGIGVFTNQSPRLKYIKTHDESLYYYISKNHPLWTKKNVSKDDLVGQKVSFIDNHNRSRSDLELNIFVEHLKYKMQFYGFSNNLSGALQILLSGHTIVPLPESYGRSIEKQHHVKRLNIETKSKLLSQMIAFNPAHKASTAANEILKNYSPL